MQTLTTLLTAMLSVLSVAAQVVEKHNLQYRSASYDVVTVVVDSSVANSLGFVENVGGLSENDFFSTGGTAPFLSITASVVDSLCSPLGLYISAGNINHPINKDTGKGNFYLKPNGFFGIDAAGEVRILETDKYTGQAFRLAIQSGPMLLIDGKPHPAFDPASQNRQIRCAVGIHHDKGKPHLVFAKSNTPVSFYEMTELLRSKYKCSNALNLESGDLSSLHLPTIPFTYRNKPGACRYLVLKL